MLGLVYLGKVLGKRNFWNEERPRLRPEVTPIEMVPVEVEVTTRIESGSLRRLS